MLALFGCGGLSTRAAPLSLNELKQLSLEQLMTIEVTSVSRHPEKLIDAASAIQVITGDEIHRSGAFNIPDALRLADNLEVAQKNPHSWAISARGFNTALSNKLLVLMDGRTVYTPLFSGVFWDAQNYLLEDIDRIEAISGPGGTLWGANAVNGVINITSKSAKDTQGGYVESGGGSMLNGFAGARYGGTLAPNVYYRVYGQYFDESAGRRANGQSAPNGWHMGRAGFRIDSDASPQNRFTLQGDYYDGDEDDETGGTAEASGGNVLGRWSHKFSNDSEATLQVYFDRTNLVDPVPAFVLLPLVSAPAGVLTDQLDTDDIDFQHRFAIGDHNRFVWGLGYRYTHDVVANAAALSFFPPQLDHRLFSGFVQDEINVGANTTVTVGSKLEHNDYTGSEVEPNIRAQWNFTDRQMIWSAVSRAVRTPSRVDRDLAQPAPPYVVILAGGPDFKAETVVAYELGYRAELGTQLVMSTSFFYNDYHDLRSTTFTPKTVFPFFFANDLAGETHGMEFTASFAATDWWRLRLGGTLLGENLHVAAGKTDINNALNETADPKEQVSLHSSMDIMRTVALDAGVRWVSSLRINKGGTPATVPGYADLDLRLAWQPTSAIELSLVGQNLLHPRHVEYGGPSPTTEAVGRSVYGKIALRW